MLLGNLNQCIDRIGKKFGMVLLGFEKLEDDVGRGLHVVDEGVGVY